MSDALSSVEMKAQPAERAVAVDLNENIEAALTHFPLSVRRDVRRLARSSSRMGDLALVFPGLLYALATRRGTVAQRVRARALIENGALLKVVASAMGLPMWLRRLPPEAFTSLPQHLPKSESFGRRIGARIPRAPQESAAWLAAVLFAERACHEDFAIWLAGQQVFTLEGNTEKLVSVIAAYAWFSTQPEEEAHRLIVVPWRPEIGFETALCAAKSWFNRLRLVLQMPLGAVTDPWLLPGTANGYTFEPLLDQTSILAEAHAMQNCADQYGERIVRERCRLFSVRRNGSRVATLEVGPHQRESGVLAINQLKARHNMAAPTDVWQAAHAWMACQTGLKRLPPAGAGASDFDQVAWERLMRPYRAATDGAPWLDFEASHLVFAGLDAELANLARRAGVMSWLFT